MTTSICQGKKIILDNIPQELKNQNNWVLWRYEPDKVLYQAAILKDKSIHDSEKRARSNDPSTWCSFDTAVANNHLDGIGYVVNLNTFTGIDLDNCLDDNKNIKDWAKEILDLFKSYTEITPSGNGLRIWLKALKPDNKHSKYIILTDPTKKEKIEIYDDKRFFAVTGNVLPDYKFPIQNRQKELSQFYRKLWPPLLENVNLPTQNGRLTPLVNMSVDLQDRIQQAIEFLAHCPPSISGQNGIGYTFGITMSIVHGFNIPEQYAIEILTNWGQSGVDSSGNPDPWSEHEIQLKVQGAIKTKYNGTIGDKLRNDPDYVEINDLVQPVDIPEKKELLLSWYDYKNKYKDIIFDYIVEDILPSVGLTIMSGLAYSGKTTLLDYMIACIASGNDFLGKKTKQLPMIFFDYDLNHILRIKRLTNFANEDDLQKWFKCSNDEMLPEILTPEILIKYITQPSLIFIDTVSAAMYGNLKSGEENDPITMINILKPFRKLAIQTKSCIVPIHHNNRSKDDFAGSGRIAAFTSAMWNYRRDEESSTGTLFVKTREQVVQPILTEMENGTFVVGIIKSKVDGLVNKMNIAKPYSNEELQKLDNSTRQNIDKKMKLAIERKQIVKTKDTENGKKSLFTRLL